MTKILDDWHCIHSEGERWMKFGSPPRSTCKNQGKCRNETWFTHNYTAPHSIIKHNFKVHIEFDCTIPSSLVSIEQLGSGQVIT